ncbi:MAG: LVIVD repeat-containing protein [Myxococcota bacterium]
MSRTQLILAMTVSALWCACAEPAAELRSSGEACAQSDECSSSLCYESTCFDPAADEDGDGLINSLEAKLQTKVTLPDSDGDGLSDYAEVDQQFDDPPDADGDGKIDALESFLLASETDGDCLAPQYDPFDSKEAPQCCCGESCDEASAELSSFICDPETGLLTCVFDASFDADADGLLPECDADDDGDGVDDSEDCAPGNSAQAPGQGELCDALDNDCDGATDEEWPELKIECLTAHPDCGGTAFFTCNAAQDGVLCPIAPAEAGSLCDDGNAETVADQCDAAGNCAGVVCDDEPPCIIAEVVDGTCVITQDLGTCFIAGECHDAGTQRADYPCKRCVPEASLTSWTDAEGGTSCDDGDPTTLGDVCSADAICQGLTCDGGGSCTSPTVVDGQCAYLPNEGGCYIESVCYTAGDSKPGWPCKRCEPTLSQDSWTLSDVGAPCDDGDTCTLGDACNGDATCTGAAKSCDDDTPCTEDTCDALDGCVYTPLADSCDDGVACTVDGCFSGQGCTNVPDDTTCDQGDPCWNDECLADSGCTTSWAQLDGCEFDCTITHVDVGTSPAADGGTTGYAAFAGDHGYVLQQSSGDTEFSVVDVSEASAPQMVMIKDAADGSTGQSINLPSVNLARRALIKRPGDPLYITSSVGFHVVNVDDPTAPDVLATHSPLGTLYGMAHHPYEPVVYGAVYTGGVCSIDMDTPTNPKSQNDMGDLAVETFDVAIGAGNRLFLAGADLSVQAFDISSPLEPDFIGSLPGIESPDSFAETVVAVEGPVAVVASSHDGYRLVDIADATSLETLVESTSPAAIYDVAFFEGYLLLAAKSGLVILDIAIPTAPEVVATVPVDGTPRGVHVDGHRVFISSSTYFTKVLDLTLPCTDDNLCTLDGCHVTQACSVVADITCDDLDPCTIDSCDSETGCLFSEVPNCDIGGVGGP